MPKLVRHLSCNRICDSTVKTKTVQNIQYYGEQTLVYLIFLQSVSARPHHHEGKDVECEVQIT